MSLTGGCWTKREAVCLREWLSNSGWHRGSRLHSRHGSCHRPCRRPEEDLRPRFPRRQDLQLGHRQGRVRPGGESRQYNIKYLRYSFFPWNRDRWSKLLKRHPDAKLPMNLSVAVPETSARLMRLANWQKRNWDGRQTALCWTCVSTLIK